MTDRQTVAARTRAPPGGRCGRGGAAAGRQRRRGAGACVRALTPRVATNASRDNSSAAVASATTTAEGDTDAEGLPLAAKNWLAASCSEWGGGAVAAPPAARGGGCGAAPVAAPPASAPATPTPTPTPTCGQLLGRLPRPRAAASVSAAAWPGGSLPKRSAAPIVRPTSRNAGPDGNGQHSSPNCIFGSTGARSASSSPPLPLPLLASTELAAAAALRTCGRSTTPPASTPPAVADDDDVSAG
jgi:hypothetical protein